MSLKAQFKMDRNFCSILHDFSVELQANGSGVSVQKISCSSGRQFIDSKNVGGVSLAASSDLLNWKNCNLFCLKLYPKLEC